METNEMLELILGEVRKVSDKVDRLESRIDNLEKREFQNQTSKISDIFRDENRQNKEIIKSILYDVAVLKTRI